MSDGWQDSASAWVRVMGEDGDYGRRFVLDAPMLARVEGRGFRDALDIGCGEGRFCRMLRDRGIATVGIDPTDALLARARERDPEGDYRAGRAEALDFADASFDLVVSYLTLIDIPDIDSAIGEMARVLRPGGTLLIANLTSFNTAGIETGWRGDRCAIDHYLEPRAFQLTWQGISIRNFHRPLSAYMAQLLAEGLQLRHFDEPAPAGGDPVKAARYRRVPYFLIMEWQKP